MKTFLLSIFCTILCFFCQQVFSQNNINIPEDTMNFFSKKNTAWSTRYNVNSKKFGVNYGKVGEMWLTGTAGEKGVGQWSSKYKEIIDCKQLFLEYKVTINANFTFEVFWDTNRKQVLRLLSNISGDGKWHKLIIPVRGKKIKIVCTLVNLKKSDGDKRVFLKQLKAEFAKPIKIVNSWLHQPIIIPTPKSLKLLNEAITLVKNGKNNFGISLNQNNIKLKKIICKELALDCAINVNDIEKDHEISNLTNKNIINLCLNEGTFTIPDKKEAYIIKFNKEEGKNIITLAANDKAGLYWAYQTLRQLILKKDNTTILISAEINDWPDKNFRGQIQSSMKFLQAQMRSKLNYIFYPTWNCRNIWNKKYDQNKAQVIELTELCKYVVARGGHFATDPEPFNDGLMTVSDDRKMDLAFKWIEQCLKLGGKCAYLGIDDSGRKEKNFTGADRKVYNNDKLLCHAWYIKKMSDRIFEKYPDTLVVCITSNYETTKGIKGYFNKIGVSPKVVILWTGAQCVTFDYSIDIIEKYEKGIEGRSYAMFDNTGTQRLGMYRNLIIGEKHGEGFKNIYARKKFIGGVSIGPGVSNQIRLIKNLQVAEMQWNAYSYNAEKARQRAIAKVSGNPNAVESIMRFTEDYRTMAFKYPIEKRTPLKNINDFIIDKGQREVVGRYVLEDKELCRYNIDVMEYAKLKKIMANMSKLLVDIKKESRNELLTKEFEIFQRNMIEIINYIYKNSKPLPMLNPRGTYCFKMSTVPGGLHYRDWGNGKTGVSVYGQQTPTHTLDAVFQMDTMPTHNIILQIEGQDCDKNIADMRVLFNGYELYKGKTPFIKNGWKVIKLSIPAKYFKKGRNVIKIINTSQSSDFIDHWMLISEITLKFN